MSARGIGLLYVPFSLDIAIQVLLLIYVSKAFAFASDCDDAAITKNAL
jgi:hypothetical protein